MRSARSSTRWRGPSVNTLVSLVFSRAPAKIACARPGNQVSMNRKTLLFAVIIAAVSSIHCFPVYARYRPYDSGHRGYDHHHGRGHDGWHR